MAQLPEFERDLLVELYEQGQPPRHAWKEVNCHQRKIDKILQKWHDRGWYDWGVSQDLGWLTELGELAAQQMMQEGIL